MWLFMPADLSQQWSDTFFSFIISDEEGISAAFIKIKQLLYSSPAAQTQNKKSTDSLGTRLQSIYYDYIILIVVHFYPITLI